MKRKGANFFEESKFRVELKKIFAVAVLENRKVFFSTHTRSLPLSTPNNALSPPLNEGSTVGLRTMDATTAAGPELGENASLSSYVLIAFASSPLHKYT